jgi:hypothetical protein
MIRRVAAALAGVVVVAGSVQGQSKKAPARRVAAKCATPAETAPWVKAQRELLAEASMKWSNDTLRNAIKTALGKDWTDSPSLQPGWMLVDTTPSVHDSTFSAMIARLRSLGRGVAGPTRTSVGVAGMRGVFALATSDTSLLRSMLHRMMEAGPDEGIKPDIAVMEDAVRLMSGRKQLYGTQLHLVNGSAVPFAIEDSAHVDLRRDSAALPALAWSVCNANHLPAK